MSVRRLADEAVQPQAFAFSSENQAWAERKMAEYPEGRQQSAVIPLLMRAQEQDGWISRPAIEEIAKMLGMAYIRVLEVATCYTMFQLKPVGTRAHIQVCGTTPCMLRGAEELRSVCQSKINHEPFEPNADGTMSWEEVECLGACVNAPMVMIGKDTYEDLTVERFEEIVDAFAAGNGDSIQPGPQIDRQFSAAQGGQTTLTEPPTAERTYKPFPPPPPPAEAPGAPAAAPAPKPAETKAPEPTKEGKGAETTEESAPALKGPPGSPKVSEAKAEADRKAFDASAKANGEPNKAMRENAVGAEAEGGKRDDGAAVGDDAVEAGASAVEGGSTSAATSGAAAAPAKKSGKQPRRLFQPPEGEPDDLKKIKGVGPVLERLLNSVGVTKWSQVAALKPDEIAALEDELSFKGRIQRDNWLEQAEVLARGGVAEHSKVFGKGTR